MKERTVHQLTAPQLNKQTDNQITRKGDVQKKSGHLLYGDSNPGPLANRTNALPLSYTGMSQIYCAHF